MYHLPNRDAFLKVLIMLLRGWQAMIKVSEDPITRNELRTLIKKTRNFLETEFGVTGIPTDDLED